MNAVEAVRCFYQAAELGHNAGAVNIGRCYEQGDGVAADPRGAEWYFRKAAEVRWRAARPCCQLDRRCER